MDNSRVRVLLSVSGPSERTNPFVTLLADNVRHSANTMYFSWGVFLLGRYDVLHLHWPEEILRGRNRLYSVVKSILVLISTFALRVRPKAVVWTVHNPHPHEGLEWWERLAYRTLIRCVTYRVFLTPTMVDGEGENISVIPHGHYKPTLRVPLDTVPRGDFVYFGRIKPYKGVPGLLGLFLSNDEFPHSLRICGQVDDGDERDYIINAVSNDDRISCNLGYLDEVVLQREILDGRIVVLPYQEMYNSGAILLALSLGRPVIVPSSPVTEELAQEVGSRWVMTYQGELSTEILGDFLQKGSDFGTPPELGGRDWPLIGEAYAAVYRTAQNYKQ